MFIEKRVYLIGLQNRLTARNAFIVENSFVPRVEKMLWGSSNYYESLLVGRRKYLLVFAEEVMLERCVEELRFVSSVKDVTEQIVDGNYDRIVKWFDVETFYRLYEAHYLNNCPVEFARSRIKAMGDKSRYIDYKILYDNNETV